MFFSFLHYYIVRTVLLLFFIVFLSFSCFSFFFLVLTLIQGPSPNAGRTGAPHVNLEPEPEQGLGERAAAPNERERSGAGHLK